jgi:hypothetical protein
MIFPARWFMQVARDTFLKGSSAHDLMIPLLALSLACVLMIRQATRKFQRNLERGARPRKAAK